MKKCVFCWLAVLCIVFAVNSPTVSAQQYFDYDQAYQILQGTWIDTEKNKEVILVWKSKDGSECNIVNNKGYTDPKGNSLIYFDYKGTVGRIAVTYYPDQNAYYGEMDVYSNYTGGWRTVYFSLTKE